MFSIYSVKGGNRDSRALALYEILKWKIYNGGKSFQLRNNIFNLR